MIEIKIDEKALIDKMLRSSEDILKKEINYNIDEFSIWDSEELEKIVIDFHKELINEVLEENRDNLKKEINKMIVETAQDIAFETLERFLVKKGG